MTRPRGRGGENLDESDKTALAIAAIGAAAAGFGILAGAPDWTGQIAAAAAVAGLTYFMAHLTRTS